MPKLRPEAEKQVLNIVDQLVTHNPELMQEDLTSAVTRIRSSILNYCRIPLQALVPDELEEVWMEAALQLLIVKNQLPKRQSEGVLDLVDIVHKVRLMVSRQIIDHKREAASVVILKAGYLLDLQRGNKKARQLNVLQYGTIINFDVRIKGFYPRCDCLYQIINHAWLSPSLTLCHKSRVVPSPQFLRQLPKRTGRGHNQ